MPSLILSVLLAALTAMLALATGTPPLLAMGLYATSGIAAVAVCAGFLSMSDRAGRRST